MRSYSIIVEVQDDSDSDDTYQRVRRTLDEALAELELPMPLDDTLPLPRQVR